MKFLNKDIFFYAEVFIEVLQIKINSTLVVWRIFILVTEIGKKSNKVTTRNFSEEKERARTPVDFFDVVCQTARRKFQL